MSQLDHVDNHFSAKLWSTAVVSLFFCNRLSTSPLTTMAHTRRDDPGASSIVEGGSGHEMPALPVTSQIAPENLPSTATPDPNYGEDGGEAHDIARASTLQTKGLSDGDGSKNWNTLANVEEEDQGGFTTASTPITGQGPPSFAQSEFYTVNLILTPHRRCSTLLNFPYK